MAAEGGYYLLLTTHDLLLTTYYVLPAHPGGRGGLLLTTDYSPLTTHYSQLLTTYYLRTWAAEGACEDVAGPCAREHAVQGREAPLLVRHDAAAHLGGVIRRGGNQVTWARWSDIRRQAAWLGMGYGHGIARLA